MFHQNHFKLYVPLIFSNLKLVYNKAEKNVQLN